MVCRLPGDGSKERENLSWIAFLEVFPVFCPVFENSEANRNAECARANGGFPMGTVEIYG
jgi:hypothetical protein